ncbi:MAG: PaaI family thioesterase [Paracoccaceae bacterium]
MTDQLAPEIEARIRESFAKQPMMETVGGEIVEIAPGRIVIEAPIREGLRQQQGFAHAGLIFTLGDNAAGYAALSVMPPGSEVLSVELKINLLSPGLGRLVAEGRVLKPGRRLVVVAADVWGVDESGARKHVAALQGTMIPVTV